MTLTRRSLGLGVGVGLLAPTGLWAQPSGLLVFAAASLQDVLPRMRSALARARLPAPRYSFGASSALARQIEQGAPADLFISADLDWMDYLGQRNLIAHPTRRNLLTNGLVLIAPAASRTRLRIGPNMPLAQALGDGRLALADPASIPAGRYARAALTALRVWPSVEAKVAPADNVRSALAFVARGEAPLGIVYATDARAEPRVRVVGTFPASTHPAIVYPAALTSRAAASAAAAAILRFLGSPAAGAVFRQTGFGLARQRERAG
jgi:molybdate transport system substrate-binding protein